MSYLIDGIEVHSDDQGYLLEADYSSAAAQAIAEAEGVALSEAHWEVIGYLRDSFREIGHSPSFRAMLKDLQAINPKADSKYLYELFPLGPAKQGARIAGLPQPYGKGGY